MAFRVRLEGADSLRKKLARFPEVSRTEVGKAVATSLVEVHGDAQRTILRGSRSGRLVSSISIEVDFDGLGGAVGTAERLSRQKEKGRRVSPPPRTQGVMPRRMVRSWP